MCLEISYESSKLMIKLILKFVTCYDNFISIDNYYIITHILILSKCYLVLTANDSCGLSCNTFLSVFCVSKIVIEIEFRRVRNGGHLTAFFSLFGDIVGEKFLGEYAANGEIIVILFKSIQCVFQLYRKAF